MMSFEPVNGKLQIVNGWVIKRVLQFAVSAAVVFGFAIETRCMAGAVNLEPYFEIDAGVSLAEAWAHADPDAEDTDSTSPSSYDYYWTTDSATAFAETSHALGRSDSCVSLEWVEAEKRFVDHIVTNSFTVGSEEQIGEDWIIYSADANTSARLKGLLGVEVNSDVYSSGYPVLGRSSYIVGTPDPWVADGNSAGSGSSNTEDANRVGPSWSMINERAHDWEDADYAVVQIGDKLELCWDGQAESYASSHGPNESGFYFGWSNVVSDFDIRPFTSQEESRIEFQSLGRTFVADRDYQYPCMYAAMAMIMDHWSDRYPELGGPNQTQTGYYEAFNQCREADEPFGLNKFVGLMNNYFSNAKNCRSGGPVPLAAQMPQSVHKDNLGRHDLIYPLLFTGPQVDAQGRLWPLIENIGHSIVVEEFANFVWDGGDAGWMAVRDTWDNLAILDDVVVVDKGRPRYRGYSHEAKEWWPTAGLREHLYFPDRGDGYRFAPRYMIKIQYDYHNLRLNIQDFKQDPNDLLPLELFSVEPAEYTVVTPIRNDAVEMWRFNLKPGSPAQNIDITFPTWVPATSHVRLEMDYHSSPGAGMNILANECFLAQITALPLMNSLFASGDANQPPEMETYSMEFDPNSLGLCNSMVDFALEFFGPSDRVLHLDHLVIENLEAWDPAANVDGVGGVDLVDFSIVASAWQEQDCGFPDWCEGADINYDGIVSIEDIYHLAENWLKGTDVL